MLSSAEFVQFILKGGDAPVAPAETPGGAALPEGFEGFDAEAVQPAAPGGGASFARRLLEAAGFGLAQMVERSSVIRSTDAVARYLPERASYWPKTSSRPYQTLLFEASMTSSELLKIPAFKSTELHHLHDLEAALARLVSEALEGFQRGGEGVTADVRKGRKEETLCVISMIDQREAPPTRLVCFGTWNKRPEGGLETFQIAEQTRHWDLQLAQEHLGLLYERQFKKLSGADWQDAFTTTEERKQAEKLLDICTRKAPKEHDIQECVLDLLDIIAKGFGLRKKPKTERRLQAFPLPADHDIGIDPEERERGFGGQNPFGGVTLRDERSRLLGYIIYPLKTKKDAESLSAYLRQHNRFHNVLVVYPDQEEAHLELWQGDIQLTGKLRKEQGYKDAADVVNLLSRFFVVSKAKVRNPTELAQELAYRARYLRRLAMKELAEEADKGPLRNLYNAFKEALVHDQSEADFADAFAQTITYGLLTARWAGNEQLASSGERLTRQSALKYLPPSSPFLNDLFRSSLAVRLDDQRGRLLWLVDDIADLLDRIDVAFVFGAGDDSSDAATDPVIHFYEPFLAAYDRELKNKRGVFFTPRAVVSYITRSIHRALQESFGLEDGLASTDTWDDIGNRFPGIAPPDGAKGSDPFVCILDPATGTGTFLFECIDIIERTMKDRWCRELEKKDWKDEAIASRWNDYVSAHLLPRLFGYELMMASYAVAHLKLSFKLLETGYKPSASHELNLYLTNSLEPASSSGNPRLAGLFETLAKQAQTVNALKLRKRFTAVLGNPPYSKISSNLSPEMRATVERYRFVDGERLKEKGALQFEINLQDDYVKFVRLCETLVATSGVGIVGLITNNGYLSTPTLRGMRDSLLETFSSISVVDLHGHLAKGESGPGGAAEENVFDILQGVAIFVGCRSPASRTDVDAEVRHAERYGSRSDKYSYLSKNDVGTTKLTKIAPGAPFYLFVPHDGDLEQEWKQFVGVDEIFPKNSAGIITARDGLVVDTDKRALADRLERFSESRASDQAIYEEFGFQESKRFDLREAQKELRRLKSFSDQVRPMLHRPFDVRNIFYHQSVVWSMSRPMAEQMKGGKNIALVATRQVTRPRFEHAFVSEHIIEIKVCSHDRNTQIFPLFLAPEAGELALSKDVVANVKPKLLDALASHLKARCRMDTREVGDKGVLTPRTFFNYVYAVLHSPAYRTRYFELLRSNFPRIPVTPVPALFWQLARLGGRLVSSHLLDGVEGSGRSGRYEGAPRPVVEKISFSNGTIWIDKDKASGFKGVSEDVWEFGVGGYQVCEKWLKDRKGGPLSRGDVEQYERILAALKDTLAAMKEIDAVVDQHGGWPSAFTSGGAGGDEK